MMKLVTSRTRMTALALVVISAGCSSPHAAPPPPRVAIHPSTTPAPTDPMAAYRAASDDARRDFDAALARAVADRDARARQANRAYAAARDRALRDATARRTAAADRVITDYDRRIARLQSAGDSNAAIAARIEREQFRSAVDAENRRDTDRAARPTTGPAPQQLDIQADIDGSDELRISPAGLEWRHKDWDWPSNVLVNGHAWDPQSGPLPLATAGLHLTPADLRDGSLRVIDRTGRDTCAVEPAPDAVTVYFTDGSNGSAPYHVRLEFLPAPAR